ncbi:MAG: tagaturonate epimerase family protein [Anaerolineae bacterium]
MSNSALGIDGQVGAAQEISALLHRPVYERSLNPVSNGLLFLAGDGEHRLYLLTTSPDALGLQLAMQPVTWRGKAAWLGVGLTDHSNALRLRTLLPFTAPVRLGVRKGAGLGDRLGLATPGHVRAMRHTTGIVPVYAQQSIREMERTNRTPEQVLDDATWGVLQEGWRSGYGADADHLKTTEDIDRCVAAGYVMYTFDPRDQVDNAAETADVSNLRQKYTALPWARLGTTAEDTYTRYAGQSWDLGGGHLLVMGESDLLRAACKYGAALAHIRDLYAHLRDTIGDRPWEVEVSVDETDTPTRPIEHWFIARELRRLGVDWVSLAPRYVGRFEKGVDYIGDLDAFEQDWAWHVAIARALGPYKLSLHSGSDKFSIYPIAARHAGELIHLKTAGTSYLEALRAIARLDPAFFREILAYAILNYEYERRSYHVSAELARVPDPVALPDEELPALLDAFDARQVLHVTFGVVLSCTGSEGETVYRDRFYALLEQHEEAHYAALETHLTRHVMPFSDQGREG